MPSRRSSATRKRSWKSRLWLTTMASARYARRSPATWSKLGAPRTSALVISWGRSSGMGRRGSTRVAYSSRTVPSPRIRTTATSQTRALRAGSRPVVSRSSTAKLNPRGSRPGRRARLPRANTGSASKLEETADGVGLLAAALARLLVQPGGDLLFVAPVVELQQPVEDLPPDRRADGVAQVRPGLVEPVVESIREQIFPAVRPAHRLVDLAVDRPQLHNVLIPAAWVEDQVVGRGEPRLPA